MPMTNDEMTRRIEDGDAVALAFELHAESTRLNAEAEMLNKLVITLRETRQQDAAKIAKLKRALKAGPARLREMADDYDRKLLLHDFSKAQSSAMAALIRSADLINAALHVEAAQEKAMGER